MIVYFLEGFDFSCVIIIVDDGVDDVKGLFGFNILYVFLGLIFDLVLVYGFGGGLRKIWSKIILLKDYWFVEWLLKDFVFINVWIYSYGYNLDWMKRNDNCFNVYYIGKVFLGDLVILLYIDGSNINLVLIGYSMGGLVVKKIYMLVC